MNPEVAAHMEKAREHLSVAHEMIALKRFQQAGRTAYLAGFNAARSYIVVMTGEMFKTHNGVHDRFYRLVKDDDRFDKELKVFLSRAYRLKSIADYEVGSSATVPPDIAKDAIDTAERFVTLIAAIIENK